MKDQTGKSAPWAKVPAAQIARMVAAELKALNLYFSLPPFWSSIPSTSCAGRTAYKTKLSMYQASVPNMPLTVTRPPQPGHPVSFARTDVACSHEVCVVNAGGVKSLLGLSSDGAGHPEMSLQRKVNA